MANAGAAPPLVYRRGEILKPEIEGVPIGLLEDREYDEVDLAVEPSDSILFFSDGVEDQLNEKGEDFSRARIKSLLKRHGAQQPKEIVDAIFSALDEFRGATQITDDQSVVVLRVQ
jgi:sigma-B regulation protein RsbU (phosphoserine phosphatase)